MPDVIVPDRPAKDVILIDGVCYEFVGATTDPKTHDMVDIDGQFDSCALCAEAEKSDLSSQSSSSGPAAQDCPSDCASCNDPLYVTMNLSGTYGFGNCTDFNGKTTLNQDEFGGGNCTWGDFTTGISLYCTDKKWIVTFAGGSTAFIFSAPNTNGCPPTGSYTQESGTCTGTCVISLS